MLMNSPPLSLSLSLSLSLYRSKRMWHPNVLRKIYYSSILDVKLSLRVTAAAMRWIDKAGGLDGYLYHTPDKKLQSALGSLLKERLHEVVNAEGSTIPPPPRLVRAQALPKKLLLQKEAEEAKRREEERKAKEEQQRVEKQKKQEAKEAEGEGRKSSSEAEIGQKNAKEQTDDKEEKEVFSAQVVQQQNPLEAKEEAPQ